MHRDLLNISYSEETISACVRGLGQRLAAEYADKNPIFLGILKGSFVFMSDLIRACDFPLEVRFLTASSYGSSTVTSGNVSVSGAPGTEIAGRHVIIVEDILDTGTTLAKIRDMLSAQNPASLKICAFLDKAECRRADISADYVGFTCPAAFFVGYGLDYAERYRNLPYVGVLKPEVYE
ncbi:MAG: hypoxanthine phosphoribosyltransferase [Oscillospiraceae bacterium]|jgi:hypoxanthine phosphoribosyltransferase|nr:hypoxanthine phosphoribosyltransferase [Oscillospiraceae bacterium]